MSTKTDTTTGTADFDAWLAAQPVRQQLDFQYCKATDDTAGIAQHQAVAATMPAQALFEEHLEQVDDKVLATLAAVRRVYADGGSATDLTAAIEAHWQALQARQFVPRYSGALQPDTTPRVALSEGTNRRMHQVRAWVAEIMRELDRARRYDRPRPELPPGHDEATLRHFAGLADIPDDDAA